MSTMRPTRAYLGGHEVELLELDEPRGTALVRWLGDEEFSWEPAELLAVRPGNEASRQHGRANQ